MQSPNCDAIPHHHFSVEAISAKCTRLGKLCIHDNLYIQNQSVVDMVSASETLTSLYIEK